MTGWGLTVISMLMNYWEQGKIENSVSVLVATGGNPAGFRLKAGMTVNPPAIISMLMNYWGKEKSKTLCLPWHYRHYPCCLLPLGGNGILKKPGMAVQVAHFFEHLAIVAARSPTWLTIMTAVVALMSSSGCGGLPSLYPEPATVNSGVSQSGVPKSGGAAALPSQTHDGTGEMSSLSVDRIAYIGPYGDLFTVNPDGSGERRLTGVSQVRSRSSDPAGPASPSDAASFYQVQDLDFNESYAWPTWSPDGTRLAVSRVRLTPNRSLEVSVQVIDAVTGVNRIVYENDVPALVADGSPHYLYWSPDGEFLSFLATTRQGLTLFVVNPDTTEGAIALERGAPLYFSWGGNGDDLMVHSRETVKLLRKPFLPDTGVVLVNSLGFRTPALSPDGNRWAYADSNLGETYISVGDRENPGSPARIVDTGPLTAFMWSPDGRTLAVADNPDPQGRIFQRLRLVPSDGGNPRTLVEEPLLAFYWSPDGQRLAWVGVDAEEQVFEWKVLSLEASAAGPMERTGRERTGRERTGRDETGRELFRFRPSGEVFTMLSFFDQYAYSHSPWSPDSSRLVVAGSEGPVAERRNGHTPTGSRIYVLDAVGDAPPAEIAQGGVAFWSWN